MKQYLKKVLAAGVFGTSVFISSAQAADFEPVVQYSDWAFRFEGAAGYSHFTFEEDGDPDINGDGGVANTAFSAAFQGPLLFVQLDGVMGFSHLSAEGEEGTLKQFTGGAFVGWRDANTGVLAANVAATGFGFSDDGIDPGEFSTSLLRVGGHGEMFFDMFTIGAAGGVIMPLTSNGFEDVAYAKGLARFYVNDNLKLEGHGGLIFANDGGDDVVYGRFLTEWKPDDSRVSYFGRWDGLFTEGDGIALASHTIMAGIRIYFGEPGTTTVKEQDRVHFTDACAFGAPGTEAIC